MLKTTDRLESLVQDVLTSAKYRDISPELVRSVGAQELTKRNSLKEALKATRSKLHQIGGAYFDGREHYPAWTAELERAANVANRAELQQVCQTIMRAHASTRERLPILDQFYSTILADLTPIGSVLDLACGLNPLAIPWMPLLAGADYYACDIYQHMMDFLDHYMTLTHVRGHVRACDILQTDLDMRVDVALLLKTIPCLEQLEKQAGARLLRAIHARHLVVSFPVHSLGGRSKGMAMHYESHFRELIGDEPWQVRRFEFASELVFVVRK